MLMTCHYPGLGSASDWSCRVGNLIRPIRSPTQIWVGRVISMEFLRMSQTSFGRETSGGVGKCRLLSQAKEPSCAG